MGPGSVGPCLLCIFIIALTSSNLWLFAGLAFGIIIYSIAPLSTPPQCLGNVHPLGAATSIVERCKRSQDEGYCSGWGSRLVPQPNELNKRPSALSPPSKGEKTIDRW